MTDKKRNSKLLPSLLFYFILLLIIAGILGIVVLTNINIAENWFGLDEYTVVETRDQVIGYLPLLWYFVIALMIVLALFFGIRKRKRALFYWIGTLVILPSILLAFGALTTLLPFDRNFFREEASASAIMAELTDKKALKDQEVQLISYSYHIRNIPLKSGVYAVARIINPTTKLQDEYWYYSTNLLQKWQKNSDTIELPIQETIAYNEIDWGVIPKVIKETEKRVAKLDHYYPGVSIVILNGSQGKWTWTVGVDDIRGHTALNLVYDLSGNYLSQWD